MASVRDTVYLMMTRYPMLYNSLMDCYKHLFFCCGNGMEWVNGELVDRAGAHVAKPFQDYKEIPETIEDVRINQRLDQIRDHFDLFMDETCLSLGRSYPISLSLDHDRGFNIPNDLNDDWKDALNDALNTLACHIRMYHDRSGVIGDDNRESVLVRIDEVVEIMYPGKRQRILDCIELLKAEEKDNG